MILTKKAFSIGFDIDIQTKLKHYKKWRKPKRVEPFSIYISYVSCYGELYDEWYEKL